MDDSTRLFMLEMLVFAIAEKVGVDLKPIIEEARNIERRRTEQRRKEMRLEEDEIFRRSKAALTHVPPPRTFGPIIVATPPLSSPDRPRA